MRARAPRPAAVRHATFDSIDTKTATVIAALLVVISLVLPNVTITNPLHVPIVAVLLILAAYALVAAIEAYSVQKLYLGYSAQDLPGAMPKTDEAARAAIAIGMMASFTRNKPILRRKAALVQRALVALVALPVPLVGLSLTGAL